MKSHCPIVTAAPGSLRGMQDFPRQVEGLDDSCYEKCLFYLARSRGKRGRLTWSLLIGYWVFSPLEISDKAQIQQLPKPGQALSANSTAKQKYPPLHHRRKQEQVSWEGGQVCAEVTAGPRRLNRECDTWCPRTPASAGPQGFSWQHEPRMNFSSPPLLFFSLR